MEIIDIVGEQLVLRRLKGYRSWPEVFIHPARLDYPLSSRKRPRLQGYFSNRMFELAIFFLARLTVSGINAVHFIRSKSEPSPE
jgi:hypothetical protein